MTKTRSKYVSAETKEKRRQSTKRWRSNKKKINWNGNKKAVGKSTRTVFSFEDVQNIIREWSEKFDNLKKNSKHDELRNYICDVINRSIKWKRVENIDMYTHGPLTNNSSKVFEMSILGLPWFVLKESVVATSTDSKGVQYGLFANRVFKKDDLLGVYLGVISPISSKEPLPTHQFRNLDAKKGENSVCPLYLGMHIMNDPNFNEKTTSVYHVNVEIGIDYLATASKRISIDVELLINYK